MHLKSPRFEPVPQDQWTPEQAELAAPMLKRGKMLNIFRTLLNHPAARPWSRFVGSMARLR